MNNQSEKPEKLKPQDSKRKAVKHPTDDNEAVVKPEDRVYSKEEPNFANPAKRRESEEQPVHPASPPPED